MTELSKSIAVSSSEIKNGLEVLNKDYLKLEEKIKSNHQYSTHLLNTTVKISEIGEIVHYIVPSCDKENISKVLVRFINIYSNNLILL